MHVYTYIYIYVYMFYMFKSPLPETKFFKHCNGLFVGGKTGTLGWDASAAFGQLRFSEKIQGLRVSCKTHDMMSQSSCYFGGSDWVVVSNIYFLCSPRKLGEDVHPF